MNKKRNNKGMFVKSHGLSKTTEYSSWIKMRARCRDKSNKYYGKKGIKVCERWENFENFLADMGKKPTKYHTIDRIDSNKDYEPSNCRWLTMEEQVVEKYKNYSHSDKTKEKIKKSLQTGYYYNCLICGKEKYTSRSQSKKFCSNKCVGKYNIGNKNASKNLLS